MEDREFDALNDLQSIFALDWWKRMSRHELMDCIGFKIGVVVKSNQNGNREEEKSIKEMHARMDHRSRERTLKSCREKMGRYERALAGDCDALWECMYERGMCNKKDLNGYHRRKNDFVD